MQPSECHDGSFVIFTAMSLPKRCQFMACHRGTKPCHVPKGSQEVCRMAHLCFSGIKLLTRMHKSETFYNFEISRFFDISRSTQIARNYYTLLRLFLGFLRISISNDFEIRDQDRDSRLRSRYLEKSRNLKIFKSLIQKWHFLQNFFGYLHSYWYTLY